MTEDATIDRSYPLQRLVHCTHTTELMASCSHSGGPTTFRQNPIYCMTLSRPLRQTPLWAMSWVTPVSFLHLPSSWTNKTIPNGDLSSIPNLGSQGFCRLPDQGSAAA